MNPERLQELFSSHGVTRLLVKPLAENDNSKNQIYLAGDLSVVNLLPTREFQTDIASKVANIKAPLSFYWLLGTGALVEAPGAQLILYPQYPEVRLSGFLRGTGDLGPSPLLTQRLSGRVLFLGVTPDGRIIGYASSGTDQSARYFTARCQHLEKEGVFYTIPLTADPRQQLLQTLGRIHRKGWIDSKRLNASGEDVNCEAPQCGGYTLEAELQIIPNGRSDPDFLGWEVKQHQAIDLRRPEVAGPLTLMTPEPTGGLYKTGGVEAFLRRFGRPSATTRGRMDFTGRHVAESTCSASGLTLHLSGYDQETKRITDPSGSIELLTSGGAVAASWSFTSLMFHWTRKHAKAVYVPSQSRKAPRRQYRYGGIVRLGEGTDFTLLIKALADGHVYYDPGMKLETGPNGRVTTKRRSQFRVASRLLPQLYRTLVLATVQ